MHFYHTNDIISYTIIKCKRIYVVNMVENRNYYNRFFKDYYNLFFYL